MAEVAEEPRIDTKPSRNIIYQAVAVGFLAAVALALVQWILTNTSNALFDGYRFQAWSSDTFMQTVLINDLLEAGPQALWYLHFQPPMLDTLRFLLVVPEYISGVAVSDRVIDQRMYALFIFFFGALAGVVFAWLRVLTGTLRPAVLGALLVSLYPGSLALATLFEATFLTALLTTLMLLSLYLTIKRGSSAWLNFWLATILVLGLTKSMFQLQILVLIPLLVFALYRWYVRSRPPGAVVVSVLLLVAIFLPTAKAVALFGTTSTSTDFGSHLVETVFYRPDAGELSGVQVPENIIENAQRFSSGENTPEQVRLNYVMSDVGRQYYLRDPWQVAKNLVWAVQINVWQALRFTHEYSIRGDEQPNKLVEALPWTPPVQEGLGFVASLVVIASGIWAWIYAVGWRGTVRIVRRYWPMLFMTAPILLTVLLANRYDWTEADRLKYILEPTFFVFLIYAWTLAWRRLRLRRRKVAMSALESESV